MVHHAAPPRPCDRIRLAWSGSGEQADFRVLLPRRAQVQSVAMNGRPGEMRIHEVGPSRYLLLSAAGFQRGYRAHALRPGLRRPRGSRLDGLTQQACLSGKRYAWREAAVIVRASHWHTRFSK